jgi:predicted secreted protein
MKKLVFTFVAALAAAAGLAFALDNQCAIGNFYVNHPFSYMVTQPEGYGVNKIVYKDVEIGATFKNKRNMIFVRATPVSEEHKAEPFDEYVKMAGQSELAMGTKLKEIQPITTARNDVIYRTVWSSWHDDDVKRVPGYIHLQPQKIAVPKETTIYYLPVSKRVRYQGEFVKAISIAWTCQEDCDEVAKTAGKIALSYQSADKCETFFDFADSGKIFEEELGNDVIVELPSNPTTGYTWQFKDFDREAYQVKESGFTTPSEDSGSGAGGLQWWDIKFLKPGKYTLNLEYARSWEKGAPEKTFKLTFNILPKTAEPAK